MNICLVHAKASLNWQHEWMYIGRDYIQFAAWKGKLQGRHISLTADVEVEKVKLMPSYLEWLNRQRHANGDSLAWWMSFLAGRNNLVSFFFLYLCQLKAVYSAIESLGQDTHLLIICENAFLLSFFHVNLRDRVKVRLFRYNVFFNVRDYLLAFVNVVRGFLAEIKWTLLHFRAARKTKSIERNEKQPLKEVYVVHLTLDNKAFVNGQDFTDRYFCGLPSWLKKQGLNVTVLPWLFNVMLPLVEVYKRLRSENCIIIWDYLGPSDVLKAYRNHLTSFLSIKTSIPFEIKEQVDVRPLVWIERLLQLGSFSNIRHWLYIPALGRQAKGAEKVCSIATFELNQPEFPLRCAYKKADVVSHHLGYYHTLISRDYFAYHFHDDEWKSEFLPDKVVTNGSVARDLLHDLGVPQYRLATGPGLRQTKRMHRVEEPKSRDLLLLLSMDFQTSFELLDTILRINDKLTEEFDFNILVKPHPMVDTAALLEKIGKNVVPSSWKWESGEINEVLDRCYCAVTLNTASVSDVVLAGRFLIVLKRELDFASNYLDMFELKYPTIAAISKSEILDRLRLIYSPSGDRIKVELLALKEELEQGIGDVNDETMSSFIS